MSENLPERIYEQANTTLRPISEGAEKWLYRPIKCLDHGFVYLVDYMGNDLSVSEAASTSYGKGTVKVSTAEGLIRYLRRHVHTTPSEMVEVKFHCQMPIFVARQWIRHRTANVNEYSGRYSVALDECFLPELDTIKPQSKDNKQGRAGEFPSDVQLAVRERMKRDQERLLESYRWYLEIGVAKELARVNLPFANYTQWYWKIDFHNLMHFLHLRLDSHAQYEIRVFGEAIARIIKDAYPISYRAFEDYKLHSLSFSRIELDVLSANQWPMSLEDTVRVMNESMSNKREREEFFTKIERLRFVLQKSPE